MLVRYAGREFKKKADEAKAWIRLNIKKYNFWKILQEF